MNALPALSRYCMLTIEPEHQVPLMSLSKPKYKRTTKNASIYKDLTEVCSMAVSYSFSSVILLSERFIPNQLLTLSTVPKLLPPVNAAGNAFSGVCVSVF